MCRLCDKSWPFRRRRHFLHLFERGEPDVYMLTDGDRMVDRQVGRMDGRTVGRTNIQIKKGANEAKDDTRTNQG